MYKVSEFTRLNYYNDEMIENTDTIERNKKLDKAIMICRQYANEFRNMYKTIKLLDYERTYKSEKLVYGIYAIDTSINKVVKEFRVYET